MGKRLLGTCLSFLLLLIFFLLTYKSTAFAALPFGFKKTLVAENLTLPTAFVEAPDGRVFVAEKHGPIKLVKDGVVTTLINLPVDGDGERGVLGLALDPSFSQNGFLYVYYTRDSPLENRVSRFTVSGDTASLGSELVLLRSTQALSTIHHAGTVRFDASGKLWISVGNNGSNANSQDLSNIHGKILRINKDGTIPSDNPFASQSGAEKSIWAYGFRNPFRMNFLANGAPIVGDVGEATWEEINIIQKGGNYGWPNAEGACANCPYINPLYTYNHNGGSASVTGGFGYNKNSSSSGTFPQDYHTSYFYGDYALGFLNRIVFDENGNFVQNQTFDQEAGAVVDLAQSTDGGMYYLTIFPGELIHVGFTTENLSPVAKIKVDPPGGLAPLTVQFSSTDSFDPEGKPLSYLWNFGDGTSSTQANPTHTYTQNGLYSVALTVSDGELEDSIIYSPIQVGNQLPNPVIETPIEGTKFNANTTIAFSGSGEDPEDGVLPESSYSWEINFLHQTHTHPFKTFKGVKSGSFVTDFPETSAEVAYEIKLTVVDSSGLSKTVTQVIKPNVVSLTFDAKVQGTEDALTNATFTLDGQPLTTPQIVQAVVGFKRTADVPTPQTKPDGNYDFSVWSDGGSKTHQITAPQIPTTFTIFFTKAGQGQGHIHFRVREFDENGNWTGKFINGAVAKLTDITGETVFTANTSKTINGEDGWVYFDNVDSGGYGILAYKEGYLGHWKQTDCQASGTTQNATINNKNTGGFVAAWQNSAQIKENEITWCKDLGLKKAIEGNLHFRIKLVEKTHKFPGDPSYEVTDALNGITVKLTDPTGKIVIKETVSKVSDGNDGWVLFNNIPEGAYGIMAYKPGLIGFAKQVSCEGTYEFDATIQNENTQGNVAAWNNNVQVIGGTTTFCKNLGLKSFGHVHFRVRDIGENGAWNGKFINDAQALLTDPTGQTIYASTLSTVKNVAGTNEDGWVYFDNIEAGNYAVIAFKNGYKGTWKQTNCDTGSTNTNASIENSNTQGLIAAWQNDVHIGASTVTWCKDLGLAKKQKGHIHFRVRDIDANGAWNGKFINDAVAKLTDPSGQTVLATTFSQTINGEEGWVYFDFVEEGNYGILTYKQEHTGGWKQTDCDAGATTQNASIKNANTEGLTAAWHSPVAIDGGKVTWCKDLGLERLAQKGHVHLRIREFDAQDNWTGKFINGVTVKLTDPTAQTTLKTQTSQTINGQDGWVFFDFVDEGNYGVLAYMQGYTGFWKQTDCTSAGSTQDATIQNQNTEGLIAAFQNSIQITANQVLYCKDLGLKTKSIEKGRIGLRVREIDANSTWNGKFINGAVVKLTDPSAQTTLKSLTSQTINGQDGWVFFDDVPTGDYGALVYKSGFEGIWKQTNCDTASSTDGVAKQNQHSENLTAAFRGDIKVSANQTTWCIDLGLKPVQSVGGQQTDSQTPVSTPSATPEASSSASQIP